MLEELETETNKIDSSHLTNLTNKEIQTLLAYAYWKDGCDDENFILSIWKKARKILSRGEMQDILHQQFGYNL